MFYVHNTRRDISLRVFGSFTALIVAFASPAGGLKNTPPMSNRIVNTKELLSSNF
jgi:hypothetical protein